jgi:hypothetical protein
MSIRRSLFEKYPGWFCFFGLCFTACGCDQAAEKVAPGIQRTDIPLRVAIADGQDWSESLVSRWGLVSEQPLEIQEVGEDLKSVAAGADILIVRERELGQLAANDWVHKFPDVWWREYVEQRPLPKRLLNEQVRWGGEPYAVTLGTPVLTFMFAENRSPKEAVKNWHDWSQFVSQRQSIAGKPVCAEPLVDRWKAIAFLNRASAKQPRPWLFDTLARTEGERRPTATTDSRESQLRPVIETEPYRQALEELVETRKGYPEKLLGPEEIWEQIVVGDLWGAVGFPGRREAREVSFDRLAFPLPLSGEGFIACVSKCCRQTTAARSFAKWLGSGDNALGSPANARLDHSDYARLVEQELQGGEVAGMLRIVEASRLIDTLSAAVGEALDGKISPETALASANSAWTKILAEQGDAAKSSWHASQGL